MIYKLKNIIQDYAWGSPDAIPDLLGYKNEEGKPQAELWMGSHRRGSSSICRGSEEISLSEFIKQDPSAVLGNDIASLYGDLPFLFKVLAAGSPLSIQVHPDKDQAEKGFARENRMSIPPDAYNRNYKDDNHKPEIICAITPFWAMRGFRTINNILRNFLQADLPSFRGEIEQFSKNPDSEGLERFFSKIMSLEGEKKSSFIKELTEKAKTIHTDIFDWVLRLYKKYPEDPAIAAPLYLNLVKLEPGEALYLAAGELHAYLDGLGMELMASSDNVLRGGLTPKYIDRDELKSILNFSGADPQVINPFSGQGNISVYSTPSGEFELSRIILNRNSSYEIAFDNEVQILFIAEGRVSFSADSSTLSAVKGESVFIPHNAGKWLAEGDAVLYRASIPSGAER